MFKRRTPRSWHGSLKEALWPSMGWLRAADYFRHRLLRTKDSAYQITAGLATGIAVSFTPFLGTHFLQSIALAWLLRANMLAAMIGTFVGNPWTLPLMFATGYHCGVFLFGLFGAVDIVVLPDHLSFSYLLAHPLKLFLPLSLGGIVCGIIAWPVSYFLCFPAVHFAQKAYRKRRHSRIYKKRHS